MFIMSREELKKVMIEMGVDPKYVEMPSIMERAFELLHTCRTPDEIKRHIEVTEGKIEVVGNVRFIIYEKDSNTVIERRYDPREKYGRYDRIYLDEYGMDLYYEALGDDYTDLFIPGSNPHYTIRRHSREKNIYYEYYYFGKSIDPEDYEIGRVPSEVKKVEQDNGDYDISCNDRTWEENKEFLCAYYPSVRKWFEQREREKTTDEYREEYEKLMSFNSKLKSDINILKEYIPGEKVRYDVLLERVRRLQEMLKFALSFCQLIRLIPLGRLLFNTKKSKLPSRLEIERDVEDR